MGTKRCFEVDDGVCEAAGKEAQLARDLEATGRDDQ